jgi:hypothetical protein
MSPFVLGGEGLQRERGYVYVVALYGVLVIVIVLATKKFFNKCLNTRS